LLLRWNNILCLYSHQSAFSFSSCKRVVIWDFSTNIRKLRIFFISSDLLFFFAQFDFFSSYLLSASSLIFLSKLNDSNYDNDLTKNNDFPLFLTKPNNLSFVQTLLCLFPWVIKPTISFVLLFVSSFRLFRSKSVQMIIFRTCEYFVFALLHITDTYLANKEPSS